MNNTLLLALLFFFGSANATVFRTADTTDPVKYGNDSWSFGTIFTVGANDINITSLGAFDDEANGFLSGSISVAIFDESNNTQLASVNVQSSDTLVDFYRYSSIDNLVLTSGKQYRLIGLSDIDYYIDYESEYSNDFSVTAFGYCASSSLTSCNVFNDDDFGMANFQYELAPVPVPAAIWFLGSGLVGLIGHKKRNYLHEK